MIAPTAFINLGRTSKFTKANDHCVVQLSALVEVGNERRKALIPASHEFSVERLENIRVMIPAAIINRDKRHAHLRQSPRQQHALAQRIAAVTVANLVALLRNVERLLSSSRGNEVDALRVKAVEAHRRILCHFVSDAQQIIQIASQPSAIFRAALADALRQNHIAHFKTFVTGITRDDKRRVLCTEEIRPTRARHSVHRHVRR